MATKWLIGGGTVLGLLLLASIVLVVLSDDDVLPEGTPGRALQLYLQAVEAEDFQAAYAHLSQSLKEQCSMQDFAADSSFAIEQLGESRVSLQTTRELDDATIVTARVTQYNASGPFGSSEYSFTADYTLQREDGEWKLTRGLWPLYSCDRFATPIGLPTPGAGHTPEPTARPA